MNRATFLKSLPALFLLPTPSARADGITGRPNKIEVALPVGTREAYTPKGMATYSDGSVIITTREENGAPGPILHLDAEEVEILTGRERPKSRIYLRTWRGDVREWAEQNGWELVSEDDLGDDVDGLFFAKQI